MQPYALAVAAGLGSVVIAAAVFDLRSRTIPNWLVGAGIVAGVLLHSLNGDGARGFGGLGVAALVYLPLYLLRAVGAGDVKLMMAVGAFAGPTSWGAIFILSALLGGVLALGLAVREARVGKTLGGIGTIFASLLRGRAPYSADPSLDVGNPKALRLPHAVPIAAATLVMLYAVNR